MNTENTETDPPSTAPNPQPPAREPKVLTMPTSAVREMKNKSREQGKQDALKELNAAAIKAGYESHEEMVQAAMDAKKKPKTTPSAPRQDPPRSNQTRPSTGGNDRTSARQIATLEREKGELLEKLRVSNRRFATEEKRRKALEKQNASLEAQMELRTIATKAGVQDLDYALTQLYRKTSSMSPEELKKFNTEDYFAKELRKAHPYLYTQSDQPLNTAADEETAEENVEETPPAPPTRVAAKPPGKDPAAPPNSKKRLNAKDLTPEEYQKTLRELGIADPSLGL